MASRVHRVLDTGWVRLWRRFHTTTTALRAPVLNVVPDATLDNSYHAPGVLHSPVPPYHGFPLPSATPRHAALRPRTFLLDTLPRLPALLRFAFHYGCACWDLLPVGRYFTVYTSHLSPLPSYRRGIPTTKLLTLTCALHTVLPPGWVSVALAVWRISFHHQYQNRLDTGHAATLTLYPRCLPFYPLAVFLIVVGRSTTGHRHPIHCLHPLHLPRFCLRSILHLPRGCCCRTDTKPTAPRPRFLLGAATPRYHIHTLRCRPMYRHGCNFTIIPGSSWRTGHSSHIPSCILPLVAV